MGTVMPDNYPVTVPMFPAAMFPPGMPAVVMNTVLCARTPVLAIVFTIVIPVAVSLIADVNANSLGADNARGRYSENGRTNKR
jgi:hypothetical protein